MIVQGPDGKRIQFPDGTPPETIKAAMAKQYGSPKPPTPSMPKPAGGYFEGPSKYQENFGGDPLDYIRFSPIGIGASGIPAGKAIDAFPQMGGIVGGFMGGVPGAGVYGGAMETLRRSLRGQPLSPGPIAWEGGKQALLQGVAGLAGAAGAASAEMIGPAARFAERAAANPVAKGIAKLLPFGGYAGRGIPGAIAGAALPVAGRFALNAAKSPQVEAFLGSMAFRSLARNSPQLAARVVQQLLAEPADATQAGSPPARP